MAWRLSATAVWRSDSGWKRVHEVIPALEMFYGLFLGHDMSRKLRLLLLDMSRKLRLLLLMPLLCHSYLSRHLTAYVMIKNSAVMRPINLHTPLVSCRVLYCKIIYRHDNDGSPCPFVPRQHKWHYSTVWLVTGVFFYTLYPLYVLQSCKKLFARRRHAFPLVPASKQASDRYLRERSVAQSFAAFAEGVGRSMF